MVKKGPLLAIVILSAVVSLPIAWFLARPEPQPLPKLYPMPSFALTSEQGIPFGSADLAGRITVANFIFTRCPTVCPTLTAKMAKLQKRFASEAAVRLVSFSVDPKHDTPEVLAAFGKKFEADPARWTFLTGDLAAVERAIVQGFKIHVGGAEGEASAFDIVHGEHFVLVDAEGQIRGYYQPGDDDQDRLAADVERLLDER